MLPMANVNAGSGSSSSSPGQFGLAHHGGVLDVGGDQHDRAGEAGAEGLAQAAGGVARRQVGDVVPHRDPGGAQRPGKCRGELAAVGGAVADEYRGERADHCGWRARTGGWGRHRAVSLSGRRACSRAGSTQAFVIEPSGRERARPSGGRVWDDDDGEEHLEAQFQIHEQGAVAGQVSVTGQGGPAGVGVPVADPDARVGAVRQVSRGLRVPHVATEEVSSAYSAWPRARGVHHVQDWARVVVVAAEQDAAGLPAVGRGRGVPVHRRAGGVGDRHGRQRLAVLRGWRTWEKFAPVHGSF